MWYGLMLTIGFLLLAIGVYRFNKNIAFIKSGKRIPATVVELDSYKDSDGVVLYRPVFVYTVGDEEFRYTYLAASQPASWSVGEKTFLVIGTDPKNPLVLTYIGAFGWSVALIAIALPLIFIGAGYFWANNFIQKLSSSAW